MATLYLPSPLHLLVPPAIVHVPSLYHYSWNRWDERYPQAGIPTVPMPPFLPSPFRFSASFHSSGYAILCLRIVTGRRSGIDQPSLLTNQKNCAVGKVGGSCVATPFSLTFRSTTPKEPSHNYRSSWLGILTTGLKQGLPASTEENVPTIVVTIQKLLSILPGYAQLPAALTSEQFQTTANLTLLGRVSEGGPGRKHRALSQWILYPQLVSRTS
ncbi:hypothetical protein BDM02DRAFT_3130872 [Thelephora ganbajun]|uniref:Uncharacterized protein n=1 Tax=Thelephora ganbajun TaxID=370292 RepID=A0ACB6Z8N9_THEGA|nr:hypothetical protein BDM02DRAFT_3130872 [Thelephora ganbajun]